MNKIVFSFMCWGKLRFLSLWLIHYITVHNRIGRLNNMLAMCKREGEEKYSYQFKIFACDCYQNHNFKEKRS